MSNSMTTEWSGRHSAKDQLRSEIWTQLVAENVAVGQPVGHIPAFVGGDEAAEQLAALPFWQAARVVKCNPDTAQIPVRLRALEDGKTVYMAVPRLTQEHCFVELRGDDLRSRNIPLANAASHQGAMQVGRLISFDEMQAIDLVVTGCVAVSVEGGRTGKGAGFADLELGMLRQLGLIQPDTPIVTTVHSIQVVEGARLPMLSHDWSLTHIVTPDKVIETNISRAQPAGLEWDKIQPEQVATIPILQRLNRGKS